MIERPILSLNRLSWLLGIPRSVLEGIASNTLKHYNPFLIERPGRKPRRIDNPGYTLKNIQHRIYKSLLHDFSFPGYIQGGVKGRSAQANARQHLGKRFVVRLDLEDFFPSVSHRQVYAVWVDRLECSPPVARLLTTLTTYHGYLPQGAPTSTSLANCVLLDTDAEIHKAASQNGCSYTRYVDDLVFSGANTKALVDIAVKYLQKAGFRISREKLVIMPAHVRQEVTGLSVNSRQEPSVPRARRSQIRAAIHQLDKLSRSADFRRAESSIRGRIGSLIRINPGPAKTLLQYLEKADRGKQDDQ